MISLEEAPLTLYQWLLVTDQDRFGALLWFVLVILSLSLFGLIVGYLVAAARQGPLKAGDTVYHTVTRGVRELLSMRWRRVGALASLAAKEALRRRVVVGVIVYFVLLGFAAWFLNKSSPDPVKLYASFVLTASSYLILVIALFLSVFSLPSDVKNRTIYTVVTKPVLAGEIVLGRILGFIGVGTACLGVMALSSYFFVFRAVNHAHTIDAAQLQAVGSGEDAGLAGLTSRDLFHRHQVVIGNDGRGIAKSEVGHWHEINPIEVDGQREYAVGPPQDLFEARVPQMGNLQFYDRTGEPTDRGISVGNEWDYRRFVQGGTQAAAVWTFDNVTEEAYPDGLPIEMYIRVFRSHKGDIEKGIQGSIQLRNPFDDSVRSEVKGFEALDAYIDRKFFPRKLKSDGQLSDSDNPETIDLFEDLVHDGKVEVWIQCLDPAQYFGVAQADVYLRRQGGRFEWNFLKGYLGIWTQMVLVICLGVMFSTFVSAPVALLATAGCIILGFYSEFILKLVHGELPGGGPFESLIRTWTQSNVMVELEQNLGVTVAQTLDQVALFFLNVCIQILPDFASYDQIEWVAKGFNIFPQLVGQNLLSALAYVIGTTIAGYFFLRLREVAK